MEEEHESEGWEQKAAERDGLMLAEEATAVKDAEVAAERGAEESARNAVKDQSGAEAEVLPSTDNVALNAGGSSEQGARGSAEKDPNAMQATQESAEWAAIMSAVRDVRETVERESAQKGAQRVESAADTEDLPVDVTSHEDDVMSEVGEGNGKWH